MKLQNLDDLTHDDEDQQIQYQETFEIKLEKKHHGFYYFVFALFICTAVVINPTLCFVSNSFMDNKINDKY